jgi:hypothetical protein
VAEEEGVGEGERREREAMKRREPEEQMGSPEN